MKTNKSRDENKITPPKKKLKQARLPFNLVSVVSPTPVAPQARKRKLSSSVTETVSKLGKISNKNDLVEDTVVISDDDSKDVQEMSNEVKGMNPYVNLVDIALKKKHQKNKSAKKKKGGKKKNVPNESVQNETNDIADGKLSDDFEIMDVDDPDIGNDNLETNNIDTNFNDEKNTTDINLDSNDFSDDKLNSKIENESILESQIKCDSKSLENSEIDLTKTFNSDNEIILIEDKEMQENTIKNKSVLEENNEPNSLVETPLTPKRSSRIKSNIEKNNISKISDSKLNESLSSNPSSPKINKSSLASNGDANESLNDSLTSAKNLTPKQLQKKQEAAKKKEERERERQEFERKRQQEKEERAKQKHEKEEQKRREREEKEEQKKREKEEKEEQKRKEKEEKEKQKELERKLREDKEELKKKEKEEKEEQRRKEREAREEEKRKKQEVLELEKQERELKKKKEAEAFANFFVAKQKFDKDQTTVGPVSKNDMLSNFTIKTDMRLAPTKRVNLSEDRIRQLDDLLINQSYKDKLYLYSLKYGTNKPLSSGKTWPKSDKDDDCDIIIIEDEMLPIDGAGKISCESADPREKLRPKLLSFHENRRPPYWGTWRKNSSFIKPRKPFGQDEKLLDYEVDSDDEWEEEQEGESIDGGSAAGTDDEQDADEYEVDNEVFVPHGYLSDEEGTMDGDDVLSLTPETQKARLKHLEDEFESEMKKPTEKLKPRMYGLLWQTADGDKPQNCVDALWNYFRKYSMVMKDPTLLLQPSNEVDDMEKKKVKKKKNVNEIGEQKSPKTERKKKQKSEDKDTKQAKTNSRKSIPEKRNQPSINVFLNKLKSP